MEFQTGVEVEVKGVEEGFQGSFYAAKIISKEGSSQYKVKFNTLLKEDLTDFLEEVVDANQLRPVPPQVPKKYFTLYEFADAYDNDGWWAGIICGKFRSDYFIYFPTTDEEKPYPFEKLRVHQGWLNGEWIFP
ncbi:hypothetical protein ACH5RR_028541 [Cinchona calisaya]|uniref:Agenet domain-containing protein n=1 Tax=Cinchona calisaya TaxID=153742 RepID=A0ABD2YT07_9GENT